MLDTFGSYLFLDSQGRAQMLNVLTENELSKIVEIGVESGEMNTDVLQKLQSRRYMLAYHNRAGVLPPVVDWENFLVPAEHLNGDQVYYFSISNSLLPDLDFEKIKSFDAFKKTLTPLN
jgi:hypothetical protein